ncbi:hypothetical protein [Candidatus Hodarchaeum mangrovi]
MTMPTPRRSTIIILLIGAFGSLALSLACVIDWIKKIELGMNYTLNLFYHPIMGFFGLLFFGLFLFLVRERWGSGRFTILQSEVAQYRYFIFLFSFSTAVLSFLGLFFINSPLLIQEASLGSLNFITLLFHISFAFLIALCLLIFLIPFFYKIYLENRPRTRVVTILMVIIVLSLGLLTVLLGRVLGLLAK